MIHNPKFVHEKKDKELIHSLDQMINQYQVLCSNKSVEYTHFIDCLLINYDFHCRELKQRGLKDEYKTYNRYKNSIIKQQVKRYGT